MSACHNFHPTSPCKSGSDADIAMPWKVCQSAPPPDYRGDFGRDPLRVKCDLILTSRWRRPGAARMWCIYVAWMKVFHFPKVVQDKWIENVRKWFKCVIFESDQTYHWIYFSTRTAKSRLVSIGQLQPQGVMSLVCGPGFSKAAILSWRKWCPQFPVGCLLVKGLVAWIHRGYWSNHIVNHMNDSYSYHIIFNMLASMSCRAFFAQTTRIAITKKDGPNTQELGAPSNCPKHATQDTGEASYSEFSRRVSCHQPTWGHGFDCCWLVRTQVLWFNWHC